jgi:ABC-type transporter Mla subunit MlaD
MTSINEIKEQLFNLLAHVDDAAGECTPEVEEALEQLAALEGDAADKMNALAHVLESYRGTLDRLLARKAAIGDQVDSTRGTIQRLNQFILDNVRDLGGILDTERFTFKVQKNPPRVNVINDELLPRDYIVEHVTHKVDKKQLQEDLRKGVTVPGAELVQGDRVKF